MFKRCEVVFCVVAMVLLGAAVAAAGNFNIANYACTALGGVPRTFSASNPYMNFRAYSLSEQGWISGEGDWADMAGGGPPQINMKVLLQCGYGGFGPASFSGSYGSSSNPIVSNNSYYDNSGMPTSGIHWNTGLAFNDDECSQFVANDSGTFAFPGGSGSPGVGGLATGIHLYNSAGGVTSPSALAGNYYSAWINNNGLVAAGDWSSFNSGPEGVVYDSVHGTSTTMIGPALYVNNAGQVAGVNVNTSNYSLCTGYVWNQNASTYWPAGTTNLSSMLMAQSLSQNGRYVAGTGGTSSSTTGVLYDASTHSIVESIPGEAFAVNNNGWLGGDTESDWGDGFSGTAWLWDGTTQHNLNTEMHNQFSGVVPSNYTICAVWGINNSSQILVWGKDSTWGSIESFLLNLNPGDANGDGKVDINDLTIVLANYNQTGMVWSQGEFTQSGTVDINDLTIVLANYNSTFGTSAGGLAAVPEPCTLALIGIAVAGVLLYGWRKRARAECPACRCVSRTLRSTRLLIAGSEQLPERLAGAFHAPYKVRKCSSVVSGNGGDGQSMFWSGSPGTGYQAAVRR